MFTSQALAARLVASAHQARPDHRDRLSWWRLAVGFMVPGALAAVTQTAPAVDLNAAGQYVMTISAKSTSTHLYQLAREHLQAVLGNVPPVEHHIPSYVQRILDATNQAAQIDPSIWKILNSNSVPDGQILVMPSLFQEIYQWTGIAPWPTPLGPSLFKPVLPNVPATFHAVYGIDPVFLSFALLATGLLTLMTGFYIYRHAKQEESLAPSIPFPTIRLPHRHVVETLKRQGKLARVLSTAGLGAGLLWESRHILKLLWDQFHSTTVGIVVIDLLLVAVATGIALFALSAFVFYKSLGAIRRRWSRDNSLASLLDKGLRWIGTRSGESEIMILDFRQRAGLPSLESPQTMVLPMVHDPPISPDTRTRGSA